MKVIFINIANTLILIVCINLLSYVLLTVYSASLNLMQQGKDSKYFQVLLPNYSDKEAAKIHFEEKAKKKSQYAATIGWIPSPLQGKSININADGNRVHKIPEGNTLNKQSVYFFGGSTTWGFGAWDNETIPALFGSITGLPTYNMGQEGWVSRQGLARFINLLDQEAKINLVIFYDGFNDVMVGCRIELEPPDHSRTKVFGKKILTKRSKISAWEILEFLFLSETKKVATKLRAKLLPSTDENNLDKSLICDQSEERARKVATTLVNNWEIAHDIAVKRNITFYAILHPNAYIGKPKVDHLQEYFSSYNDKEWRKQAHVVYPIIQEIVRERKHDWIYDYTDAFSREEYIYIGSVHTSPNGNRIIAERLYEDIFN